MTEALRDAIDSADENKDRHCNWTLARLKVVLIGLSE